MTTMTPPRPSRRAPISCFALLGWMLVLLMGPLICLQSAISSEPRWTELGGLAGTVASGAAALVWLFLWRRSFPLGGWLLLGGLPLLTGSLVFLAVFSRVQQPIIPADMPDEVFDLNPAYNELPFAWDQALVFYDAAGAPLDMLIYFESVETLGGEWAYNSARVTSDAFEESIRPPAREPEWGSEINDRQRQINPAYRAQLPITSAHLHQWITIEARIDVLYPRLRSSRTFEDHEERQTREIRLFVASPEERTLRQDWERWQESNRMGGTQLSVFGGGVLLGLLLTGAGIVTLGRSGGYGALEPALLGKTGLVVGDSALIRLNPGEPPLPPGVIIMQPPRPNTAGQRGGFEIGDVITEIDGLPIPSHRTALRAVRRLRPGAAVSVTIDRDGAVRSLMLML